MYDRKEAEGTKRRHQVDTIVEGMYVLPPFFFLIGAFKCPCLTSLGSFLQRHQSDDEQYRSGAAHHR